MKPALVPAAARRVGQQHKQLDQSDASVKECCKGTVHVMYMRVHFWGSEWVWAAVAAGAYCDGKTKGQFVGWWTCMNWMR